MMNLSYICCDIIMKEIMIGLRETAIDFWFDYIILSTQEQKTTFLLGENCNVATSKLRLMQFAYHTSQFCCNCDYHVITIMSHDNIH